MDINKGVPGKVISDVNHSPEKLALLEILPSVVRSGEYVGRSIGKQNSQIVRYDHFETGSIIGGKKYLVKFITEVYPNVNNYKTHQITEIELEQLSAEDTGTPPASTGNEPTLSAASIPDAAQNSNNNFVGGDPSTPLRFAQDDRGAGVAPSQSAAQAAPTEGSQEEAVGIITDTSLFNRSVLEDFNHARKLFFEYVKQKFPAFAVNTETGRRIDIPIKGLDKFLSGNIPFEKYASGFHIPELIERAQKVGVADNYHSETVESIPTFEYFDSLIEIEGKKYKAHIRVKNTNMGDKYYGHTISEVDGIEIEPSTRTSTPETEAVQPEKINGSKNSIPDSAQNSNKNFAEADLSQSPAVQTALLGENQGQEGAEQGWNYRTTYFRDFDRKYYFVTISVARGTDGNIVYNIGKMQERSFPNVSGSSAEGSGAQDGETSFGNSIRNSEEKNNPQNAEGQNSMGSSFSELAEEAGTPVEKEMSRNVPWIDETMYGIRYSKMPKKMKRLYNTAKKGDVEAAVKIIDDIVDQEKKQTIGKLGKDVYLLPVVGRPGTSNNVIPASLAIQISDYTGQPVFTGIYQQESLNRRRRESEERLFGSPVKFDIGAEIGYADLKGKRFLIIDDNSSYGSTIRGLETFLREHGAVPMGAFTLTVGHDAAQQLTAPQETWDELDRKVGLKNAERYAREKGFSGEFTREQVGQRLAEQLLQRLGVAGNGTEQSPKIHGGVQETSGLKSGQTEKATVSAGGQNSMGSSFSELAAEAGRWNMTAEERKNPPPKLLGEDAVFAEGDVKEWHYFVNDILFQEYGEEATTPYRVTVNVKEKTDESFVYSFNADRQNNEELSARRTLHADVITAINGGDVCCTTRCVGTRCSDSA